MSNTGARIRVGLTLVALLILVGGFYKFFVKGGRSVNGMRPDISTGADTIYVNGPINYVDRWHEKIVYIEQETDTVTVVVYEYPPPTVRFAGGTVTEDGQVVIEIMVNDTVSVMLEGSLAPSGDTQIVVKPDSTVVFVKRRFGFSSVLTGGISLHGLQGSFETMYMNNVPLIGTTVHGPNLDLVCTWDVLDGDDYKLLPGSSLSFELSPFKTPGRLSLGALYDIGEAQLKGNIALVFGLWDF